MEIKKRVLILAFLITAILFLAIMLIGTVLDNKRVNSIDSQFENMYQDVDDLQKLILLSDIYGEEMACLAFKNKLEELDEKIWTLGIKLEQYRIASEEFVENKYYKEQKRTFNENQILYLALLTKIKEQCNYEQAIITFFYRNSEDCKKCDDQSFVLTDINVEMDKDVSIFSLDLDLNITTVKLLQDYYDAYELPCVVINENTFCNIRSKDFLMEKICMTSNLDTCEDYKNNQ